MKIIKSALFYEINGKATLPKESFSAFTLNYYTPYLKMMESCQQVSGVKSNLVNTETDNYDY